MSVALPALRLSLALGGLVALVQLPFAIHHDGAAVFYGFFAALLLVALPAYAAELTFLRLHREPLLVAVFDQMSRRRFRWGWAVAGILTIVTGLGLATLAHFAAGVAVHAVPTVTSNPVSDAIAIRDYQWQHPLVLLYWLLFALMLLSSTNQARAAMSRLRRLGNLFTGALFLIIVIPGLAHFADMATFPASATPWKAGLHGFTMGVLASLAGLGLIYTALYQHSHREVMAVETSPAPTELHPSISSVLGLSFVALIAWMLALLGWADFLQAGAAPTSRGIDYLVALAHHPDLPPPLGSIVLLVAAFVLLLTAVLLSSVTLSWMQARTRIHPIFPTALLLGTALALTRVLDAFMEEVIAGERSADVLGFLPWLGPALIPLTALVMLSLFTRALPPGPMLWAQGRSLAVAAALYLHWRYPVRLALLVSFLHTSGIGAELIAFWQPATHEQPGTDAR